MDSDQTEKTESQCVESEAVNRELMAAYAWMKARKDDLEGRKYKESIIFIVTPEGRIVGWSQSASQLVKKKGELDNYFLPDCMTITEGLSFQDISAQVRPNIPMVIHMTIDSEGKSPLKYICKVTELLLRKDRHYFLVLYSEQD